MKKIEIIGWVGAILVISMYVLASLNLTNSNTISFQFITFFGCVLNVHYGIKRNIKPTIFINGIVGIFALIGVIRILLCQLN